MDDFWRDESLENEFIEFYDFVSERNDAIVPRRYIKDAMNPMEFYSDKQFHRRYRFTKETVLDVLLPLFREENWNNRGLPIPPLMKVLVALRFFATGSFQIVCGDLLSYSQPTVSRVIKAVSEELISHFHTFIHFPKTEGERAENRNMFYEMRGFPGVTGCIDGTHVPIKSPGGENAECFRNRKGYMSLNVQVICGPRMEILDIVTRWPGSTHDARVFDNSRVRTKFELGQLQGILLGDSGYPQLPFLFTPLLQPVGEAQIRYNNAHKSTRNLVERAFGVWKRRFPCLSRKLQTKLVTTTKVITACAILHNISIQRRDPVPHYQVPDLEVPVEPVPQTAGAGARARRRLIETHFS